MIYYGEKDNTIEAECEECSRVLKFRKNKLKFDNNLQTYYLLEPIECFCENVSDKIIHAPKNIEQEEKKIVQATTNQQTSNSMAMLTQASNIQQVRNIPRCPTCGSDKVEKISVSSKVVGGAMFGLFSSNVRKTYRCKNCGYKW